MLVIIKGMRAILQGLDFCLQPARAHSLHWYAENRQHHICSILGPGSELVAGHHKLLKGLVAVTSTDAAMQKKRLCWWLQTHQSTCRRGKRSSTCSIGRACSAFVAACHMLPDASPFATASRVYARRRSLSTSTPCCLSHCAPDLQ